MPEITIRTFIKAPPEKVFDLARSIDLHQTSLGHTREKAIAGVTSSLIGIGESVTWRARHFGVNLEHTSQITAFDPPHFFVDEMIKGPFESFCHEYHFQAESGGTVMTDVFEYRSPFGPLGSIADVLFLERYIRKLLEGRNDEIRRVGEGKLQATCSFE
jgi:ligand-binding SRPBCC domain-containing protein